MSSSLVIFWFTVVIALERIKRKASLTWKRLAKQTQLGKTENVIDTAVVEVEAVLNNVVVEINLFSVKLLKRQTDTWTSYHINGTLFSI
jgi:hypothetical protein